jgi:hypothetical protein
MAKKRDPLKATKTWFRNVKAYVEGGMTRRKAIATLRAEWPEVHDQMREEAIANPTAYNEFVRTQKL